MKKQNAKEIKLKKNEEKAEEIDGEITNTYYQDIEESEE